MRSTALNVVTAAQIREIDRLTIEGGVAGIALMENAAHRVAETMEQEFDPISKHNIVVLCGKGNNGGDGLALARLMIGRVAKLRVVLAASPGEYTGDAKVNLERLKEEGVMPQMEVPQKLRERREVTLVVDALLGTGVAGPPKGRVLELVRSIQDFPEARSCSRGSSLRPGRRRGMRARAHYRHFQQRPRRSRYRRKTRKRTSGGW